MTIYTCVPFRACGPPLFASSKLTPQRYRNCNFSVQNCIIYPNKSRKLVLEAKQKLEKEYSSLPVGKNGRDDEDMILWFLKDRRFSVEEAVAKLTKALRWRQEFGVSDLSEDAVKRIAETGKSYVHDSLDVNDRPVLIVVASKHLPAVHDRLENEKLCVFLIEKALSKLPAGKEQILGIIDLRGFGTENADLSYLTFLFDVFYYYYPKRLGEVLFVEAPFVFKPIWQVAKPLVKSYASLDISYRLVCFEGEILFCGNRQEGILHRRNHTSQLQRLMQLSCILKTWDIEVLNSGSSSEFSVVIHQNLQR